MLDRIIEDLKNEESAVRKTLDERINQVNELEKALKVTQKDQTLLEGRLAEVKAIIDYMTKLPKEEEEEEEEQLEN